MRPTLMVASSKTQKARLTNLSASWRVILVGFRSPKFKFLHTTRGIKLTLALRSHKSLSKCNAPISRGIAKIYGSFNLGGSERYSLISSISRFLEINSFKNLA